MEYKIIMENILVTLLTFSVVLLIVMEITNMIRTEKLRKKLDEDFERDMKKLLESSESEED